MGAACDIDWGLAAIGGSSEDGLLVMNHEYVEPRFVHAAYHHNRLVGRANLIEFVPSLGTREVLAFGEGVPLPARS